MQISYSQVESLIAELHGIPLSRRPALESRLKHFKRLKFPAGVNTGKGRPAAYDVSAILRLLIAFELLQIGMYPLAAVRIIRQLGHLLIGAAGHGGGNLARADPDDDRRNGEPYNDALGNFFILLDPVALSSLANQYDEGEAALATVQACLGTELGERLLEGGERTAVLNTTLLIARAALYLRDELGISCQEFGKALTDWAATLEWSADDE